MYPCAFCGLPRDGKSSFDNSGPHDCRRALMEALRATESEVWKLRGRCQWLGHVIRDLRSQLAIYRMPEEIAKIPFISWAGNEVVEKWLAEWDEGTNRLFEEPSSS